jgi:hypothetical protein
LREVAKYSRSRGVLSRQNKTAYSIKAVENALSMLEAFSEVEGEISITRLSERLRVNKSYVELLPLLKETCEEVSTKLGCFYRPSVQNPT